MKNLVIVESPAKAKTIAKYLGKDYTVKSSYGHIRDLPKKDLGVDTERQFQPTYQIPPDKKKVVSELRKSAKAVDTVWLATDEDREGEAIAWHLAEALKLTSKNTRRIAFHEITKSAIERAVANPRQIDKNLVDAQQARRVLDRLVGYKISPLLWKKIKTGLSAGRVQSVAVRLIVERERDIIEFEAKSSYKVTALLKSNEATIEAELPKNLKQGSEVKKLLEEAKVSKFSVADVEQKPGQRSPSPPFTTSTLQQEASSRLGFSVKQTMTLAQRLYEAGHITYMRTDSMTLSAEALTQAEKLIKSEYGTEYYESRQFQTKSKGAQEAHEAIRPTKLNKLEAGADSGQQKLYDLIRRRTLATQMSPARLERTKITIGLSNSAATLEAKGEVVAFEGFAKAYPWGIPKDKRLPALTTGQSLTLEEMQARQVLSKPKGRYTEASLVKTLEEMGIGRPSTYSPTISTVQTRGYVVKGNIEGKEHEIKTWRLAKGKIEEGSETEMYGRESNKLYPTQIAEVVTDFLVKHFADVLDYDFTAEVEAEFDKIAAGKEQWNAMISDFYQPFHNKIEKVEKISKQETIAAHELGHDPKSGRPVFARIGRYGPMLQIGEADDEEKPLFASIPPGVRINDITLKEALHYFELPRVVGKTEAGEEITANWGRYGPFVKVGDLYVSIKPDDPFTVTEERARELIKEKRELESKKVAQEFDSGLKVLRGRYGPYVTDGKKNASIPKDKDPEKISETEARELLKKAKPRRRNNSSAKRKK